MRFVEYPDREMMMIDLANILAGELTAALMNHDTVSFAVPGARRRGHCLMGCVPLIVGWDRVHVMLTDERWVPEARPL